MRQASILFLLVIMTGKLISQSPEFMNYQMVICDNSGNPITGTNVGLRLAILYGSEMGVEVFAETHNTATNANGLVALHMGEGSNVFGSITAINWGAGPFFLRVQIDPTGGSNYSIEDTSQMVSVPYTYYSSEAQNAHTAGNGFSHVSEIGDTLYFTNGGSIIVPGISSTNLGCTDNTACNYNSSASQDDGSCYFIGEVCDDGNSSTNADVYNANCVCEGGIVDMGTIHSCGTPNIHNPDLTYGSMTDQEGNVYKTIVIGTQEWMAENLNTSIYRNGDSILTNLNTTIWWNTDSGAWAYYNNDANYACPYGKLYNWYACADARQLCPVDWHVPTDAQLTVLINYLGGGSFAGGKMKTTGNLEASTGLWNSPNTGATNISGFSGIPAGTRRNDFQEYDFIGQGGYVWSSSENGSPYGWYRRLVNYNDDGARDYTGKRFGYSVRCLRD